MKHSQALAMLLLLLFPACVSHKPTVTNISDLALANSFQESGDVALEEPWWTQFQSEELNQLVEEALSDNLALGQAWARLKQAESLVRRAKSSQKPTLDLVNGSSLSDGISQSTPTVESESLSLNLSYSLDVWGRIAAEVEAGRYDLAATRQDLEATALTLSGRVALTWMEIIEARLRFDILKSQLQVNQDYLDLIEARYGQGLASGTEVYQQRQQVASVANSVHSAERAIELGQTQMALLLGRSPMNYTLETTNVLPDLPSLPELGIPAETLAARPDVKRAEMQLRAADARHRVAKTHLYPRLDLSASLTSSGAEWSDLWDNWMINLSRNLLAPIFDGGSRRSEVARNKALVEERFLGWKQTVFNAAGEVEDSLIAETTGLRELTGTKDQLELAKDTLESARSNYVNGTTDYLTVLNSLQALQRLELEVIQQQRALVQYRMNLYLALGGQWTSQIEATTAESE